MISVSERKFLIKNKLTDRKINGMFCTSMGITVNLMLFFVKLIAGCLSGSVSVTVDAVHNLTDMCSSVVAFISFLLPEKNKTVIENTAGLIIGIVLIVTGCKMMITSAEKIINPEKIKFSSVTVVLLIFSVFVKLFMALLNKHYYKKTQSPALNATFRDCLCDCIATTVALTSVVMIKFTDANIDSYGGIIVSMFILFAGGKTVTETIKGIFTLICRK